MQLETKKLLEDIRVAADLVFSFIRGKSLDDYRRDAMLKSAVERQFTIIGEAIRRLSNVDRAVVSQIGDFRRIIAFRNVLVHGYDVVSDDVVWDVVEKDLAILIQQIQTISLDDETKN